MSADAIGQVDLTTTQPIPGVLGAWLITLAALLVAWFGRKRLPPAVSETLFVIATSAVLLSLYPSSERLGDDPAQSCAIFTALAVLWHLAGRWIERGPTSPPDDFSQPGSDPVQVRKLVAENAVIVCGLLAAAFSWLTPVAAQTSERLAVSSALLILAAVALHRRVAATGTLGRYAALALVFCTLRLWLPAPTGWAATRWASTALLMLSFAALAAALFPVLEHWQRRRRVWRADPERLLDPPREFRGVQLVVWLLGIGVGVGGLLAGPAPLAVFIAAFAALTVEHRRRREQPAALGLALVADGIVLAAMAWLPASPINPLLGLALAGAFLLWLSRFWQQQLHDGVPWTTAGRLLPVARRLAYVATAACFVMAATFVLSPSDGASARIGLLVLLMATLVALGLMLARAAASSSDSFAALAACLAFATAALPAQWLLQRYGVNWPLVATIALAAPLLALRVGSRRESRPADLIYNACLCGALPLLVAFAALAPSATSTSRSAIAITAASVIIAVVLRLRTHRMGTLDVAQPSSG